MADEGDEDATAGEDPTVGGGGGDDDDDDDDGGGGEAMDYSKASPEEVCHSVARARRALRRRARGLITRHILHHQCARARSRAQRARETDL